MGVASMLLCCSGTLLGPLKHLLLRTKSYLPLYGLLVWAQSYLPLHGLLYWHKNSATIMKRFERALALHLQAAAAAAGVKGCGRESVSVHPG